MRKAIIFLLFFFTFVFVLLVSKNNVFAVGGYAESTLAPTSCGPEGVTFNYTLKTTTQLSQTSGFNNFYWYTAGLDPEDPPYIPLSVLGNGLDANGSVTLDPAGYQDGDTITVTGSFVQWDEVNNGIQVCDLDPNHLNDPSVESCGQTLTSSCSFYDPGQNECKANAESCQFSSECCSNYCDTSFGICTTTPPGPLPTPGSGNPVPEPPVPCDQQRPDLLHLLQDEFHSLRPYQASPCSSELKDLAPFCGNDVIVTDTVTMTYSPGDSNCHNIGGGKARCDYNITQSKDVTIDLSGAELPILGNTEDVENSQSDEDIDNISDADKLNQYVSWYLNGVVGRAEYPFLSVGEESSRKIVDFSGPLNKLLPQYIQKVTRINTIKNNKATRHNQIVACDYGIHIPFTNIDIGGFPAPCYPSFPLSGLLKNSPLYHTKRINFWSGKKIPPLEEDYDSYVEYQKAYKTWRGDICGIITIPDSVTLPAIGKLEFPPFLAGRQYLLCVENPLNPDFIANLFPYIPYSSTEDRLGQVQVEAPTVQSTTEGIEISNVQFTNQNPASLFFAHTEESVELSRLLQQTYAAKGTEDDLTVDPSLIQREGSSSCNLVNVRTNSGDDLFAGAITGTLSYSAAFSCDFDQEPSGGPINATPACAAETNYVGKCYPGNYSCTDSRGRLDCPQGYKCATQCEENTGSNQECDIDVSVALQVKTKTPNADEIWARTVAGAQSVFKRIYPKVGPGAPVEKIVDLPAETGVIYSGEGIGGEPAHLYFPHIGAVSEYFLKGIQTALRPKGFGSTPKGSLPPGTSSCTPGQYPELEPPPVPFPQGGAPCEEGTGYCSVSNLLPYFNGDSQKAHKASVICNRESGGNPSAFNDGCLNGITADFSIGLFQINLLAHGVGSLNCPGAFACYSLNPPACEVIPEEEDVLTQCANLLWDPEININKMLEISNNGTNWAPWSAANACGII